MATPARKFVHLHVHSEYSLLDGANRIKLQSHHAKNPDHKVKSLITQVRALGMSAMALTDHGNMCGALEFYREARAHGVKAIMGMEAYVAPDSRLDKSAKTTGGLKHLTLLVKEERGRTNLMKLSSLGHEEGFHYRPRIDRDLLIRYHEGLIVLSGCLKGELSSLLLAGKEAEAEKVAGWYKDLLGPDRYFIELMEHGIPEQKQASRGLVALAKKLGLSTVATNDVHYLEKENASTHEILLCIQTGKNLDDPSRMKFQTQEFYLKSPAEMAEVFRELPEAIEKSWEIAERCGLELTFSDDSDTPNFHVPPFPIPDGYASADDYLRHLCMEGTRKRFGEARGEIMERLDHELGVISHMGFSAYFLIVGDMVEYAKSRGILVGPGRGSAAGSMVSYVLGITDLDPLKYGLIFERFLNPGRTRELPDIDIDFPDNRREEVLEYVRTKYGSGNVAQIVTFARMNARAVVRDVGRVMGLSYGEMDRLAKMIPGGPGSTLAKGLETQEMKNAIAQKPQYKNLMEAARVLESVARHASKHAAGIVIAPPSASGDEGGGLRDYVPLLRLEEGVYVTQFDMDGIKALGLLKIDLLGLRTLTVLDATRRLVLESGGPDLDYNKIPVDDDRTYELFREGRTDGIFQFESSGMRDALRKLKPDNLEDLIALNALYRPGPMEQIDTYIRRRRGLEKPEYVVPEMEPILKSTYGIIVYQEQVLQTVHLIGGYTMAGADDFRRSMGKKKAEIMEREEQTFIRGAAQNGIAKDKAERIFEFLEKFAGYGFNRSHSAAYALLAYWTAYLKTHYPVEFMAALLTSEMGSQDKMAEYVSECRKIKVQVLPPDINGSRTNFSVERTNGVAAVRFGMAAVKNVGRAATDAIIEERERGGEFKSLGSFCERIETGLVNRKVLESLVKCGAFDRTGSGDRERMIAGLATALDRGARRQADRQKGQEMLFGANVGETHDDEPLPDIEQTPERNRLSYEKELLGCYVSGHPLAEFEEELKAFNPQSLKPDKLSAVSGGYLLKIAGVASRIKNGLTKKKEPYMRFQIEDLEGTVEVLAWPEVVRRQGQHVSNGAILMVTGTLQRQEDGRANIIAKDMMPLEEAQMRLTKAVHLTISTVGADEEMLNSLQRIAALSPGTAALYLHMKTLHHGEAILEAGQAMKVAPTRELIGQFKALLGDDGVAIADRLMTAG